MNLKHFIGAVLLAIPFVLLFAWIAKEEGWKVACGVFIATGVIVGIVALGCWLLDS